MSDYPLFQPGMTLSAAEAQALSKLDTYTPELVAGTGGTDPDLGTSPYQDGRIQLNGTHVTIWGTIGFGSSPSVGSGLYQATLPAAYPIIAGSQDWPIGVCRVLDASPETIRAGICIADNTLQRIWFFLTANDSFVSHSNPWTWASNDVLLWTISYPTDFGT